MSTDNSQSICHARKQEKFYVKHQYSKKQKLNIYLSAMKNSFIFGLNNVTRKFLKMLPKLLKKFGTTRKIVSSNRCQRLAAVSPTTTLVKFENLVHSIFRNENSTLEIHVSHFGVLHWQKWQHPASAPD